MSPAKGGRTARKPVVVVTRRLPEAIETRLMELFDARLSPDDAPMTRAQLAEALASADVLVPTVTDRLDAELLAARGPTLRLIASYGTGVDHIDLKAAQAHDIVVTNTPDVLTEDTADLTMAMILAVPRRVVEGLTLIREGRWEGWGPTHMLGHRIHGKRLGIVGMGRIGRALARRARGFGMAVHYHNRHRVHPDIEAELEATWWESLDQMLARMDVISIHCPHTPATYHLLSARRLKLLQPHACLINTARGEVVDEEALTEMLLDGRLAGAALDVFEREPAINPRLLAMPNVLLLPHMGSATVEARLEMGEKVLINIKTFIDGHPPPDRVLDSML